MVDTSRMATTSPPKINDGDVFSLTPQATTEIKSAGTSLSARELEMLVLIDGTSTLAQIAANAAGMTRADVDALFVSLLQNKLITLAKGTDSLEADFLAISVPPGFFKKAAADPETDQGVSSLTKKGYYVRIARRSARPLDLKGEQPMVLVIDDDADLMKLIRSYFRLEGFTVREATNRAGIMAAFGQSPLPHLVLLDVNLPDASGFDILVRIRQHPLLKTLPVVMITAETTRQAVLKALQAGADGFITKPFEPDQLVSAVREVLGLKPA